MKTNFFLVVNGKGSGRIVKTKPSLDWNEVAIHLQLELPEHLFTRPQLTAKIALSEKDLPAQEIPLQVQDNIQAAIQQATGVPVRLEFILPQPDEKEKL